MLYLLLTLDLKNVTDKQRSDFNAEMEKRNWTKIKDVTTLWYGHLDAPASNNDAIRIAKESVSACASAAKVDDINVCLGICNQVIKWKE